MHARNFFSSGLLNFACVFWFVFLQIDQQLATGEYFLREPERNAKKWQEKREKQAEAAKVREEKRKASFQPPQAAPAEEKPSTSSSSKASTEVDVEKLKKKVKNLASKQKRKVS